MERVYFKRDGSAKDRMAGFLISQFKLRSFSLESLVYILKTCPVKSKKSFLLLDISKETNLYKVTIANASNGTSDVPFLFGITKQVITLPITEYGKNWFLMPYSAKTMGLYDGVSLL